MKLDQLIKILESNKFLWFEENAEIIFNKNDHNLYKDKEKWCSYKIEVDNTNNKSFKLITDLIMSQAVLKNLAVLIEKNNKQVVLFNIDYKVSPQENQHWEIVDK